MLLSIAQYQNHSHYCWQFVIKREFLNNHNLKFIDVKITEDIDFVTRMLCYVKKLYYFEEIFYWQRSTVNSLSKIRDIYTTISFLKVIHNLLTFCKIKKTYPKLQVYLEQKLKSNTFKQTGVFSLLKSSEIDFPSIDDIDSDEETSD